MIRHQRLFPVFTLLAMLVAGAPVSAQQGSSDLSEGIARCRAIAEREARFTCYDGVEARDNAAAAVPAAPASPAAVVAPMAAAPVVLVAPAAAATPATPAQALDDFGKGTARLEPGDAGQMELVDRVAGLKEVQYKQWQITLEGGQVWRQQLSQTFNLKQGYEVRITPISGGPNHRLSSPQVAGAIQVRRVR